MGGVLKVGDAPIQVHGTCAIHLYSPNGPASLSNTHFVDLPASWVPVVNLESVTNAGVVLEVAGSLKLDGPPDAQCSVVMINIGGTR